ncbi:hypothetical protein BJV82DRAFT_535250 [Fennellomyces sp. T-0311]|nr:hypothetical protein BJV82DRAFT_535250 [Fennellomyces sp. T-0311]
MPGPVHPFTDFHKAGYSYLLFCWVVFLLYCLLYQTDQLLKTWARQRRRRNGKRRRTGNDKEYRDITTPLDMINDLLRPLEHTVTVPYIATMISLKHLLGMTLFSLINFVFCYFAPFKLHPEVESYEFPILGVLDRRAVYVCQANWSFAIILATRNNILTSLCGLTFEELVPIHRWVARVGLAETILHSVYRWWEAAYANGHWYDAFMFSEEYFSGTVSTIGYIILFVPTFNYIRRTYFRTFYYTHLVGFLLGTGGAMWHEWSCIYFFAPPTLLWIIDRMLRSYRSWYQPIELIEVEQYNEKIIHAKFTYGLLDKFRPGQYLFAAFLTGKKGWRNWIEQHGDWYPMTVSDIFKKDGDSSELAASIHIKALGDGTRNLMEAVRDEKKVALRVDGPYGPRLRYLDYEVVVLFALGIGITPGLTILKDCVEHTIRRSSVHRAYLIWSSINTDEVLPFTDYIQHCMTYSSSVQLDVTIHLTREPDHEKCRQLAKSLGCTVIQGQRPNVPERLDKIAHEAGHTNVWVHTCGSVPFMTTIINEATKHNFDFHHETFEF